MTGTEYKRGVFSALQRAGFAKQRHALHTPGKGATVLVNAEKGFGDQWFLNAGFCLHRLGPALVETFCTCSVGDPPIESSQRPAPLVQWNGPMLWLMFLVPPVIFGRLMHRFPGWGIGAWGPLVSMVGVFQVLALWMSGAGWTYADNAAMVLLVAAVPWLGALMFSATLVTRGKKYRALIGVPLCYFLLFGLGVGLGDASGLIPQ